MAVEEGRAARDERHFTSAEVLAEGLDSGGVGVWRWEVATGKLTWSHNLESIHRLPPGTFDGTFESFSRDIHADDRARVMEEIQNALATRNDYRVEYRLPAGDTDTTRWIEARGRVFRNADSTPAVMTGICTDITSHKNAEVELALRARQHEAVVHLGEKALAGADLKAVFDDAVANVAELISADFAEILELSQERDELVARAGFGWPDVIEGQSVDTSDAGTLPGFALRAPSPVVVEDTHSESRFSLPKRSSALGVRSGASVTIGGGDGTPFGVLSAYCLKQRCVSKIDVRFLQSVANIIGSAIRANRDLERRELLIGELRHRVGNLFSLVQALHRQTGQSANDAQELEMKFGARLAALASAHTLILEGGWQRTSLRSLLETTLAPYIERVDFSGADVRLPADAAFSFSMALHELATNANKYGSLSIEGGKLHIDSRGVPDGLGRKLVLVWKEVGGSSSPGAEQSNGGFGTKLINQVVERQLSGQVVREFESDGLRMTIEFPIG
jgi:two-component sensor histidine kinase